MEQRAKFGVVRTVVQECFVIVKGMTVFVIDGICTCNLSGGCLIELNFADDALISDN